MASTYMESQALTDYLCPDRPGCTSVCIPKTYSELTGANLSAQAFSRFGLSAISRWANTAQSDCATSCGWRLGHLAVPSDSESLERLMVGSLAHDGFDCGHSFARNTPLAVLLANRVVRQHAGHSGNDARIRNVRNAITPVTTV